MEGRMNRELMEQNLVSIRGDIRYAEMTLDLP